MQSRQDAIGRAFQFQLETRYKFLIMNDTGSNLPDFSSENFYLEAKCGFHEYGGRIKPAQIKKFHGLDKPVFYVYGFHEVEGLARMKRGLAFQIIPHLKFGNLHIVDNVLIEKFFKLEQRFAEKEGPNVDNHYCVLKPRHFRQIIGNGKISRNNQVVNAQEFYGINPREWNFDKVGNIQLIVTEEHRKLMNVFDLSQHF